MNIGKIVMIPQAALDLLYPRRCPICHEIAPVGRDICPECLEALPYVTEPRCRKCGKPVEETEVFCEDCMKYPRSFEEGSAAFIYDDRMRETIRLFKNKGRKEYGSVLGRLLYQACRKEINRWRPELIVPVPLHRSKLRARGYNQAEIVAREVSERSGIPMRSDALIRSDMTKAMRKLNESERRKNLEGAFTARKEALFSEDRKYIRSVLLIDDIFTTGSTIDACSKAFKSAGVQEVFFLTVCTGAGASAIF